MVMGWDSVYRSLQEVFPQLDKRILNAVAKEHSKDADAAVEAVLVEVIPYMSERSSAPCSSNGNNVLLDQSRDSSCRDELLNGSSYFNANGGQDQGCISYGNEELASSGKHEGNSVNIGSDLTPHFPSITIFENEANNDHEQGGKDQDSSVDFGSVENSHMSSTAMGHENLTSHISSISLIDEKDANDDHERGKYQDSSVNFVFDQDTHILSNTLEHENRCVNGSIDDIVPPDCEGTEGRDTSHSSTAVDEGNNIEQSCLEENASEVEKSVGQLVLPPVQEATPVDPKTSDQLVVVSDMLIADCEIPESSDCLDVTPENNTYASEMIDLEDESTLNTSVTRSGEICRIDLLENIIGDAKSNKKTLFTAMESVINLMREVEDQEKAAEQAEEEAIRGGMDILTQVEELKNMLHSAKEANDMHGGEVYGEKAILATEVKELQSRLLSLSDERDKSLSILDEMRQTLELRLAAAEEVIEAAEQKKLEKVKSARKALAEQELVMEKVVEESKILKQEAEENSKLREFLMDRGQFVDMLQGEISVICQDVKLLKEKFDERLPLSKSLSSSQTSCILASSSSSLKGLALPDHVPDLLSEIPKKTSPNVSDDDLQFLVWEESAKDDSSRTPKKTSPNVSDDEQLFLVGGESVKYGRKAIEDDGWEMFEDTEY